MFEEMERLRECAALAGLLTHYGRLSEADRDAWHPRRNKWDGADAKELSKLHGELIAYGWLDLAVARSGAAAGGYRITVEGRRALREIGVVLATPAAVARRAETEATAAGPASPDVPAAA